MHLFIIIIGECKMLLSELNWKICGRSREDGSDADSDHHHHEDDDYDDWVCGEEGLFTGSAGFFFFYECNANCILFISACIIV